MSCVLLASGLAVKDCGTEETLATVWYGWEERDREKEWRERE